jgi:hypothetical protein
MAMTMAMLMMTATVTTPAMIDHHSLLESNGIIAATLYFLFIFNENARRCGACLRGSKTLKK